MPAVENKKPFADYGAFVAQLKRLAEESCTQPDWNPRATAALNGSAGVELRRVASLETRRKFGAFFTGSDLSARLIATCSDLSPNGVFYDPSNGMGDLLLAAANQLPIERTLMKTLHKWGRQLAGTDLHRHFIEGTKTRLVLLARQRHGVDAPIVKSHSGLFPMLRVANGLHQRKTYLRATHLLLNPPYGLVDAPPGCKWAGGRITEAAIFVITALERVTPGTEILAILPDVLRSGSFTELWRRRVAELAEIRTIEPYGIFDDHADVDVFLLRLIRRKARTAKYRYQWPSHVPTVGETVGDYFDVHVGRVVPHRDEEIGPRHPYIHPRCVPPWTQMRSFSETRRHMGKVYQAPFVVIRRTSRPGHPYRATATIIGGNKSIAVENHFIVCEPKDKTVTACKKLMRQLKSERVNTFLNNRIRCRHLTVSSIAELPWDPQ